MPDDQKRPSDPNEVVQIGLPVNYWVTVLAGLEILNESSLDRVAKLRAGGLTDPAKLSPEQVTLLVGPMLARGIIVQELIKRGHMNKSADDITIDALLSR